MRTTSLPTRSRRLIGAVAGVVLCVGLVPAMSQAAPPAPPAPPAGGSGGEERPGNFDARRDGAARKVLTARRAQIAARPAAGVRAMRKNLGVQGIVDIDPLTATPRRVARLDGFLTGPSSRAASAIALDYVRANPGAFGLNADEIAALELRKEYVDAAGTRHLSFVQQVDGVPVFGNGLRAHVARDGRLIQVDGSPVAALPASLGAAKLTATQAREAAVADVAGDSQAGVRTRSLGAAQATTFTTGDRAQLVVFQTTGGPRLAWQTITLAEGHLHVIDSETGRVLFRQSLVAKDTGLVWDNYPGAARGGVQRQRDLTRPGWLPRNSPRLAGNVAHVYSDVNDDDIANPSEEVAPSAPRRFHFPFNDFTDEVGPPCSADFQCSWNPDEALSWEANREQNATQLFYFLGLFHDHLNARPIRFTRSAGNFEAVDGDAVQGQAMDGANLVDGLPDGSHVDNANMLTPPDGIPPRMQMFLFHTPGDDTDPFLATNSGDTADIVFHEYTHGLSNRLVVDANGVSTLGNVQAGAMGEGWGDWYAWDYLVSKGLERDTAADGEVRLAKYTLGGESLRSQPMDCSVGSTSAACPGTPGAGAGGYTYGDFGRVTNGPQVHADGEIWSQTLWDLRTAIGSWQARSLVTRAMELSPANPSYLDMRNSILQADLVAGGGKKQKAIWKVFAKRGMGWFAGAIDGDDTQPVEDFSMPPAANTPRGSLTGTVTDTDTGAPVAGAVVAFGGHASGFGGDYAATTGPDGTYTISGILPGTYPKVFARAPGYDLVSRTASVASRVNTLNWSVRRDWAALAGGSEVVDFNGEDNSQFGCGPSAMFDQSQGSGWSADAVYTSGLDIEPRFVVVRLPEAVDIVELSINPSNTCGDAGSASASRYTVETSTDGETWQAANSGDFGPADRNRMNPVELAEGTAEGVQFVRYTMLSTQVEDAGGACPGPFSGCDWVDSVELAVYGVPDA